MKKLFIVMTLVASFLSVPAMAFSDTECAAYQTKQTNAFLAQVEKYSTPEDLAKIKSVIPTLVGSVTITIGERGDKVYAVLRESVLSAYLKHNDKNHVIMYGRTCPK